MNNNNDKQESIVAMIIRRTKWFNIFKLILFAILIVFLLMIFLDTVKTVNRINNSFKYHDTITVQVEYGNTLYDIAKKSNIPIQDIRDMVYYICKYNSISNSDDIKVGQKIYVPVNNK